ncbi:MAG: hypothetical protein JWP87_1004 [Labilithrix sp.]|nr:hypothetical protein [Labilithrix sp.]
MKTASVVMFVAAGVAALVAAYLYSFCMLLESGCHAGDASACARLAGTLRGSMWTAAGAVACVACGFALRRASGISRNAPHA